MTPRFAVLHLLLAVCATVAAANLPGTLEIAITSPPADEPVFGQVEVIVAASSLEPVAKVELFVDGRYEGVRDLRFEEWRPMPNTYELNHY